MSENEEDCLSFRFYSFSSCFSTAEQYFYTKVFGQEYKSSRSTEGSIFIFKTFLFIQISGSRTDTISINFNLQEVEYKYISAKAHIG